jgi:Cft2 family RNA processing exonuclease
MGPYSLLLDCGLAEPDQLRTIAADFVFCSHAHTDHCRGLLSLHRTFPHLPIFSSAVTARLLPLNWPGEDDTRFCRPLPWRSPTELAPGLTVQLWPAGHLPGATCFLFAYKTPQRTYTVFYSGDCFLSNGRLVDGLPLSELRNLKPDVLIMEGTYGLERHPNRRQQENYLVDRLTQALENHGRAVFPCPLLGLGQELIMLLRSHHHFTGQPIDIWVDPIVAAGCDAYLGCLSSLPATVQNFAQHQPLFWDERVLPRVRRLGKSISPAEIALSSDPAVFIVHPSTHPSLYCQAAPARWSVFMTELDDISLWQGQFINDGAAGRPDASLPAPFDWMAALQAQVAFEPEVAEQVAEQAVAVEPYMLTSHADRSGTTQLIHNLRPQHIIFVHGELAQLTDLASLDDLQSRYHLHLPTPDQTIDLPLADAFWQPAPPRDLLYEGEVTAGTEGITLTLPNSLESDPRWSQLADTGIVEASWQGDQLVIRGLNQQALMQVNPKNPKLAEQTCYYCRHLRGQRCRNPQSPLVGLQVTSDGSCGVFERSAPRLDPMD